MQEKDERHSSDDAQEKAVISGKCDKPNEHDDGDVQVDIQQCHDKLFQNVFSGLDLGFATLYTALTNLQTNLVTKLTQIQEQQKLILISKHYPEKGVFYDDVQKINRSLESFLLSSDNLSHIKLTLTRAAAFAAPEGNLAQLVSVKKKSPTYHSAATEWKQMHVVIPPYFSMPPMEPVSENLANRPHQGLAKFDMFLETQSTRIPYSTCFVFYLPPTATNETLIMLFKEYGQILHAYVAMDKVINRCRGFGFVDFSTPEEAQAAMIGRDKYVLEGKYLSVSIKV
jgi:hypothetical protein